VYHYLQQPQLAQNMSTRARKILRDDIKSRDPVNICGVEAVQKEILLVVQALL